MTDHPVARAVLQVRKRLGDLGEELVLVGGSAVVFLVPGAVAATIRPTEDIDWVVQARSTLDYYGVANRLRGLGFKECAEPGAPLCRWVIEGYVVDVMPSGVEALGFTNPWYDEVLSAPDELPLATGSSLRVATTPAFLATKLEAFDSRGGGQYWGDTDFEDVVTVLAYRRDCLERVRLASGALRQYLGSRVGQLVARPDVCDLVSACLPADKASQDLVPHVLATLQAIAVIEP